MTKTLSKVVAVMTLLVIGNRLFNHVNPWLGLTVVFGGFYLSYKLFKSLNNEKKN